MFKIDSPLKSTHTTSEKLTLWLAFGGGFGFIRPAPGTWGTLPGVLLAYLLSGNTIIYVVVTVVLFGIGVWLCDKSSKILGVHDHSGIVIDEIVGVMIALFLFANSWLGLLLGFILFRAFDIIKPPPIKQIDKKVHGGIGIMLDDVLAGVFAWVMLYFIA